MSRYYVWSPDDGERPSFPNSSSTTDIDAAEQWAKKNGADSDHANETLVRVESLGGEQSDFRVERRVEVRFYATRIG